MRNYIDTSAELPKRPKLPGTAERPELVGLPGVIETGHLHQRLAYGGPSETGQRYVRGAAEINREIRQLVADGELHRVKRGVYVRGSFLPGGAAGLGAGSLGELRMLLAARLYAPSYVSGETALRLHGLVSLAAVGGEHCITSVTAGKNRTKSFETTFGRFAYYDIPQKAYDWGVQTCCTELLRGGEFGAGVETGEYRVAGPEKALCDAVYLRGRYPGRHRGLQTMVELLYDGIGLDPNATRRVDIDLIWKMQDSYPSTAVRALARLLYRNA